MALPRVIPVLLLKNKGLVKSVKFKNHKYVGDPINVVKIFNEKQVDELCFLDIDAASENREPFYDFLKEISTECFMPLSYGGGIRSLDQIKRLVQSGIEKVIVNTSALEDPIFVKNASATFGSSTIVGAIDVKKNLWGSYHVFSHLKNKTLPIGVVEHAVKLQELGVGEIFLNNVDLDGTMQGYDNELISQITGAVDVPVIACGGCGTLQDIDTVVNKSRASAAAAGSFFVYHGKHKAVLITYPDQAALNGVFNKHLVS